MKRQIFTLLLSTLFGVLLMAQPSGVIKKASTAPVIDGVIDAVWATANVYNVDLPFMAETPTLGSSGETTWKGLWTIDGIFILIQVSDDKWQPAYSGDDPGSNWMYDKPEIYFDVNSDLLDGVGGGGGLGHYQVAPGFIEGETDGTPATATDGVVNAFKVTAPNYVAEYFIPFSKLLDRDGYEVDKTAVIGFDVTVIDGDVLAAVRNRAVWANNVDPESYTNMDGCGTITLEGAGEGVLATSISISSAGDATTIETEAGTLQMIADILPLEAEVRTAQWKVENGTGKASISTDGLLTALMNGTVSVIASTKDGSNKSATMEITISNQIVTIADVNLIKNGDFAKDGGLPQFWGFWSGNGGVQPYVSDGVVICEPVLSATEGWQYQFNQSNLTASPDFNYIFSFVAWSDADRAINVDFEDTQANGYKRYGTDLETSSPADWIIDISVEPTRFTYHLIFDNMVETTIQKLQFMLAQSADIVYIDSIYLISEDDFAQVSAPGVGISKNSVKVLQIYPNPVVNELYLNLSATNSRVAIYNSLGCKMEEVIVEGSQARIDVNSYAKGLYFVRINNETVRKFVVK